MTVATVDGLSAGGVAVAAVAIGFAGMGIAAIAGAVVATGATGGPIGSFCTSVSAATTMGAETAGVAPA